MKRLMLSLVQLLDVLPLDPLLVQLLFMQMKKHLWPMEEMKAMQVYGKALTNNRLN
jgi:hypothetical protein